MAGPVGRGGLGGLGGAGAWLAAKGAGRGASRAGPSVRLGTAGPTERQTGLAFPSRAEYVGPTSGRAEPGAELLYAGAGARAKSLLGLANVNVYAVGLLINPASVSAGVRAALGKVPNVAEWAASPSCQGALDEIARDDGVEKIIHLVVKFPRLKPPMLRKALDERLVEPMTAGGQKEELAQFQELSEGLQTKRGDTISFCLLGGGDMLLLNNGVEVGTVRSALLCSELLDIYLGASAVSPGAKEAIAAGIHRLVTG